MVYLVGIVTLDLVAIVLLAASTPLRWPDIMAFVALMACGAVCIEATRRLGMPAGVSRDLLSAWWLPVALLLPPLYALLAPIVLQILLQLRVRATVLHRRVFSAAAIGLAGCAASMTFHRLVPDPAALTRGAIEPIGWAVAAAVVFALLNTSLIALAAHMADPEVPWRSVLWDKESALLDVVELCLGVSVAISAGLNLALLILALPPVVLLQRSLLHAQLQAAARTDPKTGLLNAAAWQREADTEIVRARRTGETLALLIVDIDHFKRVNDRHGHLVGDQVLAAVAATLRSQLREYDVVGRFGGEEFVVLLPGADVHEARQVAERLRNRISHMAVAADDAMITVTISVGVAIMSLHGDDLIELLAAADLALYRAKELGRDRICLPVIQPTHLADTQTAPIPVPALSEDPHPEDSRPEGSHQEGSHPEGTGSEGSATAESPPEGSGPEDSHLESPIVDLPPAPGRSPIVELHPAPGHSPIAELHPAPGLSPIVELHPASGLSPIAEHHPAPEHSPVVEPHLTPERSLGSAFGSASDGGSPVPDLDQVSSSSPPPEPRPAPDHPPSPGPSHSPKLSPTPEPSLIEEPLAAEPSTVSTLQEPPPTSEPRASADPSQTDEPQPTPIPAPPQLSEHPPPATTTPNTGDPATPGPSGLRDRPSPADRPQAQVPFSSSELPQAADSPEAADPT
ncbi:diguanylate cyclase [Nonomuraea roseoviolacea]|uniref:Diguanylate cyclase (GGDEF)-like protein n=1 Tax=Nonomuraea roseoviolacea subsp. carminata TaxID=160689 RepID=A0ABT1K6T8_9ACTN|nr:diguanylate cyclase [Nonomuraea roseoviolacea]MCP2349407.1 diguanylate cyclase (GGDEF)-like protein [Nonomuraea roseoviolacea subsp. carminata]